VYAATENNDAADWPNCRTGIYRRSGGSWTRGDLPGFATYFMCRWGNSIVFTYCNSNRFTTVEVYQSTDGVNFNAMGQFSDWWWVPTVYKNELYVIGHKGKIQEAGNPCGAIKWTGNNFVEVAALTGVSHVVEWQCAAEHNGYMFLGAGGWLLQRGDRDIAAVYRYDGASCVESLRVAGYSEASAIGSHNGVLYAAFASGFKYDGSYATPGNSQVWSSIDNGSTWTYNATFPMAQLYVLLSTGDALIAAGGNSDNLQVYSLVTGDPTVPVLSLQPPTNLVCAAIDNGPYEYMLITWDPPTSMEGVQHYEIASTFQGYPVTVPSLRNIPVGPNNLEYRPTQPGNYTFRIRIVGEGAGFYSTWTEWTPMVFYLPEVYSVPTPIAPVATLIGWDQINIYVPPFDDTDVYTELFISIAGQLVSRGYIPGLTGIYTIYGANAGATYTFCARYIRLGGYEVSRLSAISNTITILGSFEPPLNIVCSVSDYAPLSSTNIPFAINISWQYPYHPYIITDPTALVKLIPSFEIERKLTTGDYVLICTITGDIQYRDVDVTPNNTMTYRVRARYGSILSSYSYSNTVPEPPTPPFISKISLV